MATDVLDVGTIRTALAAALEAIDGANVYDLAPDSVATGSGDQVVALTLLPGDPFVDYHASFGGSGSTEGKGAVSALTWLVRALVTRNDLPSAQRTLDELASTGIGATRSVLDALYADRTLGGAAQILKVESVAGYGPDPQTGYLRADWTVTVWARR